MSILQMVLTTIISTGVVAIFIQHHYDKKIRKHDLKIEKYILLGEELSRLMANNPDLSKLHAALNSTYVFSSEDVVKEVLSFNEVITNKRVAAKKQGQERFQLSAQELVPLIKAIRKELGLGSDCIKEEKISFFMGPNDLPK